MVGNGRLDLVDGKVRQIAHLVLPSPAEEVLIQIDVELDYSDCGIERVSVLDFIASSQATRIERTPESVPGKSVRVGFDGWAFPRRGVGFVWVRGPAHEKLK